jgi:hypothetical protein
MTLSQIENAIAHLPRQDLATLTRWFGEFMAAQVAEDDWDKQILADSESGKLDGMIAEALADISADRATDL